MGMGAIAIACFQTTNLENCIMKLSLQYLRYLCLLVSAIGLLHFKAMPAAVAAVRPKITETSIKRAYSIKRENKQFLRVYQ
jgi:NO-binding membrane sensor protein with MHYT domain